MLKAGHTMLKAGHTMLKAGHTMLKAGIHMSTSCRLLPATQMNTGESSVRESFTEFYAYSFELQAINRRP